MRDSVDIDLALYENRCEQAGANEIATYKAELEAQDAPVVAYTAKLLTSFDAWARGVK